MGKFLKWLTVLPEDIDDHFFFTRIRKDCSEMCDFFHELEVRGHKWDYDKDEEARKCPKCGREQSLIVKVKEEEAWKTKTNNA